MRRQVSPMTQMPMAHTRLVANRTLLAMIKNDSEYAELPSDAVSDDLPDSVYALAAPRSAHVNPPPLALVSGLDVPAQGGTNASERRLRDHVEAEIAEARRLHHSQVTRIKSTRGSRDS